MKNKLASFPVLYVIYTIVFVTTIFSILYSQENNHPWTINGTDPTEPRTRGEIAITRIEPISAGYILEFPFAGELALKNWVSLGLTIPLVYADFPSSSTFELGDMKLSALISLFQQPNESVFKAIGIGGNFFLNSGDVETGTGFGQPTGSIYIAASFYPAEEILLLPIVQEYISVDQNSEEKKLNELSIPELIVDLRGDTENLWSLRSSIGKMVNEKVGLSADFFYQLAGEKRFQYLGRFKMRYLL
jgi:hypothetical protein